MGETYYEVLGVSPDASQEEIEAAYRDRVLETHPDQNDDPDAAEAFDRVTTAEEVLSDEAERARYDRLGHDAYVRLEEGGGTGTGSAGFGGDDPFDADAGSWASTDDATGSRTGSHHARQRRRRNRATGQSRTDSRRTRNAGSGETSYVVHDWDDDLEVERERRSLDQSTAVIVGSIALLYPFLVFASVTPTFHVVINGVIALSTLVLVGYLLTMPTVAVATFGLWSVLVPVGLPLVGGISPFSALGLIALAAFWVPFGYAIVVRWALRP